MITIRIPLQTSGVYCLQQTVGPTMLLRLQGKVHANGYLYLRMGIKVMDIVDPQNLAMPEAWTASLDNSVFPSKACNHRIQIITILGTVSPSGQNFHGSPRVPWRRAILRVSICQPSHTVCHQFGKDLTSSDKMPWRCDVENWLH